MELSSASTTIASGDLSFSAQTVTCTSMRNGSILLMRHRKQRGTGFQPFLVEMNRDRTPTSTSAIALITQPAPSIAGAIDGAKTNY
jgi:hypothetical protein